MSSFDAPFLPPRQGTEARQEKLNDSFRYEGAGALTMRCACCFVWQSEGTDYLNHEARQEKLRRLGWLAVK
ncbi:hypothetical protein BTR22_18885 [Alkalihalophilus pseudofirmus]|nr:hypothetical protein BTR22_18885 [Alkalihalophilus pseudofirmus]